MSSTSFELPELVVGGGPELLLQTLNLALLGADLALELLLQFGSVLVEHLLQVVQAVAEVGGVLEGHVALLDQLVHLLLEVCVCGGVGAG